MTKATRGPAWPKAPPASVCRPAPPDYHWLTGSFRDPALERRFLDACEGNFVRRDRYVAAIICCLECLLIGLDIHLLANYPEVLFWRLASSTFH